MANLEKVIYINEEDYSTLLNGGSITKSGTTYTYDSTALYVIKDVGAPEYAETAGYATSAGTATKATQDGSGNAITETYATKASGATEILYTDENSSKYNVTVGDTLNEVITALDDAIGEFHVTVDSALSETSENAISNKAITQALYEDEEVISASLNDLNERMEEKQDLLVSGTNIKTVNGNSLLGSGNITIEAGGSGDVNVIETVKVNGTALTPDANKAVNVVVPTALSALSTDSTHQLVTSTEKSNWNSHTGNTEVHVTTANKNTWNGKQDALVSGTNIKTVNGNTLLGSGNVAIPTGETNVIETVKVNGTALTPDSNKAVDVTVPTALSALSTDSTHQLVTSTEKSNWNSHTGNTEVHVTSNDKSTWSGKQDALVSGTNIKTINTNSLLGSGDITIPTGETNVIETIKINGTAQTVTNKTVDLAIPMPDSGMSTTSENPVQNKVVTQTILDNELVTSTALNELNARVDDKQDELVSGINLKTINNNSLLGSGNLTISTGETNVIETVKVNGTALTPDANKAVDVTVPQNVTYTLDLSDSSLWIEEYGHYTYTGVDATLFNNINTSYNLGYNITLNIKGTNDAFGLNLFLIGAVSDFMYGFSSFEMDTTDNILAKTALVTEDSLMVYDFKSIRVPTTLSELTDDATHRLVTDTDKTTWNGKQDALVSGTNIKTVNNESLLGSGNVAIATGQNNVIETIEVNGTAQTVTNKTVNIAVPTALSSLTADANHRFVTDTEKTTWNGKVSKTGDTMTGKLTISSGGLGVTGNTTINGDIIATGQTKLYSSGNTLLVTGGTQINGGLTASTFSGNSVTAERIYRYGHTNAKEVLFSDGSSSANITLTQLPTVTAADNGKILMVVNGAWALVSPTTIYTGTGTPSSSQGNNGDIYLQTT